MKFVKIIIERGKTKHSESRIVNHIRKIIQIQSRLFNSLAMTAHGWLQSFFL